MGKRLSIRTRLVALTLIPAIALLVLTGLQLAENRQLADDTAAFEQLVGVAAQQLALLDAVQQERARTLEARFTDADVAALDAARATTDAAIDQLRGATDPQALADIDADAADAAAGALSAAEALVEGRQPPTELSGTAASLTAPHTAVQTAVLAYDDAIAPLVADPDLQRRQQLTSAVVRLKATALQRGEVVALGTIGEVDRSSATRQAAQLASQQQLWIDLVQRVGTEADRDQVVAVAAIDPAQESARVSNGLLTGMLPPPQAQFEDLAAAAADLREVELDFADAALATAADVRADARRGLLLLSALTAATALFTLLVLVSVTRGVVRPLRRITALAQQIGLALPGTVESVAAGAEVPDSEFATSANVDLVRRGDELGDLARAIRASTETAVLVATDQARTRAGVAKTIMDVARREQSLVEQQLALLDRLEDAESDPEQLANLFGLDHLATRMRRNAENLLLFASGELPGGPGDQPTPLVDVIRGAASEIEEYTRVDVALSTAEVVTGYASTPLSHLIAELVENATLYSPPSSRVQITAAAEGDGVVVRIRDHGIGMSEEELEGARQKLAETPLLEAAESRRLGLYVVGLLAARLGVEVRLSQPADGRGTLAEVLLPPSTFVGGAVAPAATAAAPTAPVPAAPGQPLPAVPAVPAAMPVTIEPIPPVPTWGQAPAPAAPPAAQPAPAGLLSPTAASLPSRAAARTSDGNGHTPSIPAGLLSPQVGLSLARESGDQDTASGSDLDHGILGGFFDSPAPAALPPLQAVQPPTPTPAPATPAATPAPPPAPSDGAFSTPSWAPPTRGDR